MTRNTYVLIATLGSAALLLGAFGFQHIAAAWGHRCHRHILQGA